MIQLSKPDFDQNEYDAIGRVLESGWVVQGKEVSQFEQIIGDYCEVEHCVVVSSGHAALHLIYLVLGIGPGDAVFVPSFAWPSAANVAELLGARTVFVDVLPDTYNMDVEDLEKKIHLCKSSSWGTPRLLVPVHEFGLMAEMDKIFDIGAHYQLDIIEDAACALGATYNERKIGSYGQAAILSFHPRKAITTGEGGAIITNDPEIARHLRIWRNHGQTTIDGNRDFVLPGLNYRMTEFQASIGQAQMEKFPGIIRRRKEIASIYYEELMGTDDIQLPEWKEEHTWQTFMIVLKRHNREPIIRQLRENGIEAAPGAVAGHMGKYFVEKYGYEAEELEISWKLHTKGLALPLHSRLTNEEVKYVLSEFSLLLRKEANDDLCQDVE